MALDGLHHITATGDARRTRRSGTASRRGSVHFADPAGLEHEDVPDAPLTASAGDVPAEHARQTA